MACIDILLRRTGPEKSAKMSVIIATANAVTVKDAYLDTDESDIARSIDVRRGVVRSPRQVPSLTFARYVKRHPIMTPKIKYPTT